MKNLKIVQQGALNAKTAFDSLHQSHPIDKQIPEIPKEFHNTSQKKHAKTGCFQSAYNLLACEYHK